MAQRSRVPKFGDWENEKTIHDFSKAREDKIGGKPINPNDPQQNPGVKSGVRSSGVASPSWDRKPSESNDKVPPRTPERSRMKPPEKVAVIPKFGDDWDENDPDSAIGYTVIFNKVREEKQTRVPWDPHETIYHGSKQAGSKRRRILRAFDSLRRIRIRKSGGGMSKPNDPDMNSSSYYDDNASIRSECDEGNPYGESTSGNIIYSNTVWREGGLENKSCSSESPDQPGIVNNKKRRWLSWWWRKK